MVLKVGINGFGRVGRVVLRTCLERSDVEVCAINDPAIDISYVCYLIKYDSTHGTLKRNVSFTDNEITIDDIQVKVFQKKFPTSIPWHAAGAEYIVEASGMFTSLDKASGHLVCDGVKRVIVTAPCIDVPMVILGVNEKTIKPSCKVISCGSSTLYCLAPIIKILEDNYGVEDGFITSIHAMTPSLKPLDGICLKGKHWRDHRSITQNIIPAATGACKALGRIIPAVKDRMCGLAFRVPIANVSVLDLTVRLKKFTSIENIVSDIEKFNETTENIIKTNSDESVSSDFIGDSYSCILDITSSIQLKPNSFKLICWYENEYSYACRVIDLIIYSENQFKESELSHITRVVLQPKYEIPVSPEEADRANDIEAKTANVRPPASVKNQREVRQKKSKEISGLSFKSNQGRVCMCRIWNDGEGIVRRSRPTALFQVCKCPRSPCAPLSTTRSPPLDTLCLQARERLEYIKQDAICTKAHERLEKVKQEFSKMVNITENLLKKSYNSKLSLDTVTSSKENIDKGKQEANANMLTLKSVENYTPNSSSINDMTNSMMSTRACNSKNAVDRSNVAPSENMMSENIKSDLGIMLAQSVKELKDTAKTGDQIAVISKSFVSTTFTEIFKGISDLQRQFSFCKANAEQKEDLNKNDTKSEDFHDTNENNDGDKPDELAKTQSLYITHTDTENEQPVELVETYVEIIDDIDEKENDVNNEKDDSNEKDVNNSDTNPQNDTQNETEHKQCDETNEEDTHFQQLEMTNVNECCSKHLKTTACDVSKCDDVLIEETACTGVASSKMEPHVAWTPSVHCVNKEDIYDKLESVSGSDHSFEADIKKSEIINIKDLTNSLEDLDRLDKICRIMEISDELSDKLLSTLNKSDEPNVNLIKKRWSFKDLCEKVNLDEFCNKVFGK